jgi:Bacterial regulatory proteins, tetR family
VSGARFGLLGTLLVLDDAGDPVGRRQARVQRPGTVRADVDAVALQPVGAGVGPLVDGDADVGPAQPVGQAQAADAAADGQVANRRSPGQAERRRDPERTRQRLLDAAAEEFGAKGFGGARVRDIAARVGLNMQLIFYYFGGKAGLYAELQRRWGQASRWSRLWSVSSSHPRPTARGRGCSPGRA